MDDDYALSIPVHGAQTPGIEVTPTPHDGNPYCLAELPASCAYKYWLIFKLVPLLLHLVQFLLQCGTLWYCGEFVPQQIQYEAVIIYLYPEAGARFRTRTKAGVAAGAMVGAESDERRVEKGLETETDPDAGVEAGVMSEGVQGDSASNKYSDSFPTPSRQQDILSYLSSGIALRRNLLVHLQIPYFYSVFSFIEVSTAIYVWIELRYPSTYCGAVRPPSLYYSPILMTLLDMIKFNIYVCTQYCVSNRLSDALLALFNMEIFATNIWVTVYLFGWFIWSWLSSIGAAVASAVLPGDGSCLCLTGQVIQGLTLALF